MQTTFRTMQTPAASYILWKGILLKKDCLNDVVLERLWEMMQFALVDRKFFQVNFCLKIF